MLFSINSFAQDNIYIWSEIEPGWKTRSQDYWADVKGYGKSVPSLMSDLINEYYSIADKKLELSLKDKLINSNLSGRAVFTDNPGKVILKNNDLFVDLQCRILEISDEYPYIRTSKIKIEPVIIYNITIYNSKGDVVDNIQFADEINYKVLIRPTLRGLPEHKRDIEIVRQSFVESFSGNAVDQIIQELTEKTDSHKTVQVNSDPGKFNQVLGLLFENRKLQYPWTIKMSASAGKPILRILERMEPFPCRLQMLILQ